MHDLKKLAEFITAFTRATNHLIEQTVASLGRRLGLFFALFSCASALGFLAYLITSVEKMISRIAGSLLRLFETHFSEVMILIVIGWITVMIERHANLGKRPKLRPKDDGGDRHERSQAGDGRRGVVPIRRPPSSRSKDKADTEKRRRAG